jgi:hypothetical protein
MPEAKPSHTRLAAPSLQHDFKQRRMQLSHPTCPAHAAGVAFISRGRTLTWPRGRHSLCGDPWNMARPHKHMVPRPIQARYTVGETINIHVLLTTNHLGRFEFRVCPRNATAERHCTRLERCVSGARGARAPRHEWPLRATCMSRSLTAAAWLRQ